MVVWGGLPSTGEALPQHVWEEQGLGSGRTHDMRWGPPLASWGPAVPYKDAVALTTCRTPGPPGWFLRVPCLGFGVGLFLSPCKTQRAHYNWRRL